MEGRCCLVERVRWVGRGWEKSCSTMVFSLRKASIWWGNLSLIWDIRRLMSLEKRRLMSGKVDLEKDCGLRSKVDLGMRSCLKSLERGLPLVWGGAKFVMAWRPTSNLRPLME